MTAEKRGRGRPKGAKNKKPAKGRTAPTASGTVSTNHNKRSAAAEKRPDNVVPIRPELTDEQLRTIFFQERTKVQAALKRKTDADTNYKNVCKSAKGMGVDLGLIKLSLKEPDVLEAHARERAIKLQTVCRWMNLPLGTQLSLLDEPVREHSDDKAYKDGELAGLEGKDESPPYAPNLPQANAWRKGYRAGQEKLASRFKLADEVQEAPDAQPRGEANGTATGDAGHNDVTDGEHPLGDDAEKTEREAFVGMQ